MASKFNTVNVEDITNLHVELSANREDQKNLTTKLETSSVESKWVQMLKGNKNNKHHLQQMQLFKLSLLRNVKDNLNH